MDAALRKLYNDNNIINIRSTTATTLIVYWIRLHKEIIKFIFFSLHFTYYLSSPTIYLDNEPRGTKRNPT